MLNILNHRHPAPKRAATRVALVGDSDRRAFVKAALGKRVEYAGELVSDRRITLLDEVSPEIVFLDCGSKHVNPLISLPILAGMAGSPRVIALVDRYTAARMHEQLLRGLGADAIIDIYDAPAIARAAGLVEERRIQESPDRSLSPVAA